MATNCLKSSLKLLNSAIGLGGIAVTIYGILMIRVWQPEDEKSSYSDHFAIPCVGIFRIPTNSGSFMGLHAQSISRVMFKVCRFFHAFLGVGITLCAITCLGYIAAQTANVYCLSCYIIIVLLLLILETVIMADLFLNPNWRKELPKNLTERLDEFKDFVESSDDVWNWVAWLIFMVEGVCVLLATILRTQDTNEVGSYESEYEDEVPRLPLLGPSIRRPTDPNIV